VSVIIRNEVFEEMIMRGMIIERFFYGNRVVSRGAEELSRLEKWCTKKQWIGLLSNDLHNLNGSKNDGRLGRQDSGH
jgi:hypothetical protein